MNLSNLVQQVSGETVTRAGAGLSCVWSSISFSSWDVSGLRSLCFMRVRPMPQDFSLPYPPQWPESSLVLCWTFQSWAGEWSLCSREARTPLASPHGQSSGFQHKPGPQKGALSGFPWCRTSCRGRMGNGGHQPGRVCSLLSPLQEAPQASSQPHTALPTAPFPQASQGHRR